MSVIRTEGDVVTFLAGASGLKQYSVVKADSSDGVVVAGGAAEKCIGILINSPDATSAPAEVVISGGTKGRLGGTVAFGDYLESNSGSTLVPCVTDKNPYVAIALQSGVTGDIIEVYVKAGYLAA